MKDSLKVAGCPRGSINESVFCLAGVLSERRRVRLGCGGDS